MSYKQAVLKDNPIAYYPLDIKLRTYGSLLLEYSIYGDLLTDFNYYSDIWPQTSDSAGDPAIGDLTQSGNNPVGINIVDDDPIVAGHYASCRITPSNSLTISNQYRAFSQDSINQTFSMEFWVSFNNLFDGQNGTYDWNIKNYLNNNSLNDGSTSTIPFFVIKDTTLSNTIGSIFYDKATNTIRFRIYGAGGTYVDSYCLVRDLDTQLHVYASYYNKTINININNQQGVSNTVSDTSLFATSNTNVKYVIDGTTLKTNESFLFSSLAFYNYRLTEKQIKRHMLWAFNDDKPVKSSIANVNRIFTLEENQDMFAYRRVFLGKSFSNATEVYNLNVTDSGLNPRKLQHGSFNQLETATISYGTDGASWIGKKCGIDFPDFGSIITIPGTITMIVKPSTSNEYILSIDGVNGSSTLFLQRSSNIYNLNLYDVSNGTTTTIATINSPGYYDKIAVSFNSSYITLVINGTVQTVSQTISFSKNSILTIGQSYHLGKSLTNLLANSSYFSYLSITDEYRTSFPSAGITNINGYEYGNLRQDVITNSSAESNINYWSSYSGPGRNANSISQTSEITAYSGTKSVKFIPNANKGITNYRYLTWYEGGGAGGQVTPGKTYVASVYYRSPVPVTVVLYGEYKKQDATYISSISGTATSVPANTWTRLYVQSVAPASAGYLTLAVRESTQNSFPFRENLIINPSFEVDTTNTGNVGANVTRSTAFSISGSASALLTSTGSGNMGPYPQKIGTTYNRLPVNPSTSYIWSAYVLDVNTGATYRTAIEWYDSNNTLISAPTGLSVTASSSTWKRSYIVATSPSNAAWATPTFYATATVTAGNQAYFDAFLFEQESVFNIVSNSNFEQGSGSTYTGWTKLTDVTFGTSTSSQNGTRSMRFTSTSAGNTGTNGINIPLSIPLLTTDIINVSYYARRISGTGQLAVAFDGVGSGYALSNVPIGNLQGDWVRVNGSVSMTGAYMGSQRIYQTVANDVWEIDAFQITTGGTTLYTYTNSDYFDGSTGLTYQRWTGTANASTSLDSPWSYADALMLEESSVYNPTINPAFESNTTNWSINVNTTPGTLTQVSNLSPILTSGLTSAMQVDSSTTTRSWNFLMGIMDNPTGFFVSGQTYTLSFYARLLSGSNSGYRAWFSNAPSLHNPYTTWSFTPTSSWQRFSYTFTATDNGYTDTMWHIDIPTSTATSAQFTGFQVEKASSASTYTNSTYFGTSLTGGYPWQAVLKYTAPMTSDLFIDQKGYWINSFPLTSISKIAGSKVDWTRMNNCIVEYSKDYGSTWYALPRRGGHIPGYDFTGKPTSIMTRITLITNYAVQDFNQSFGHFEIGFYKNLSMYTEDNNFMITAESRDATYKSTYTTKLHNYQILSRPNNIGLLFTYDNITSSVPGYAQIKNLNNSSIGTVDFWFRPDSIPVGAKILTGDSAIVGYPDLYLDSNNTLIYNSGVSSLYVDGAIVQSGTYKIEAKDFYHIAVIPTSYTGNLFLNGTATNTGLAGTYGFISVNMHSRAWQIPDKFKTFLRNKTTIVTNDNLLNSTSNQLAVDMTENYPIAYYIGS